MIWATVPIYNGDDDGQEWTIKLRCDAAEAQVQGGGTGYLAGAGSDGSRQTVPVLATVYTNSDAPLEFWGYGFNIALDVMGGNDVFHRGHAVALRLTGPLKIGPPLE